jgi:hypothetical protein
MGTATETCLLDVDFCTAEPESEFAAVGADWVEEPVCADGELAGVVTADFEVVCAEVEVDAEDD